MEEDTLYKTYYELPCGLIKISASETGVTGLHFVTKGSGIVNGNNIITECVQQVDEYFKRKRKRFSLPLDLQGTNFQKKVWNELLNIPFGKTISYLDLAIILEDRNLIRAVGGANGRNPVSIIVPCHRVIGSNGDLVGYGGGLDKKKWLLEFEGVLIQQKRFA